MMTVRASPGLEWEGSAQRPEYHDVGTTTAILEAGPRACVSQIYTLPPFLIFSVVCHCEGLQIKISYFKSQKLSPLYLTIHPLAYPSLILLTNLALSVTQGTGCRVCFPHHCSAGAAKL